MSLKKESKQTPINLIELGSKYIFYKASQNTTWYIFFETSGNRYLVTFITNNYSEIIQFYNKKIPSLTLGDFYFYQCLTAYFTSSKITNTDKQIVTI